MMVAIGAAPGINVERMPVTVAAVGSNEQIWLAVAWTPATSVETKPPVIGSVMIAVPPPGGMVAHELNSKPQAITDAVSNFLMLAP
jgi:hypothetical protein